MSKAVLKLLEKPHTGDLRVNVATVTVAKMKKALESRLKGFSGNGTLFYEVFCFQAVWKAV